MNNIFEQETFEKIQPNPIKWVNRETKNLQLMSNSLPEKPFKKVRILKSNKSSLPYKNTVHWVVTNGALNVKSYDDIDDFSYDENGIMHITKSFGNNVPELNIVIPVDIVSLWSKDEETGNYNWLGVYQRINKNSDTFTMMANHYNLSNGGICSHISYLQKTGRQFGFGV
jgi:hypothetical protein